MIQEYPMMLYPKGNNKKKGYIIVENIEEYNQAFAKDFWAVGKTREEVGVHLGEALEKKRLRELSEADEKTKMENKIKEAYEAGRASVIKESARVEEPAESTTLADPLLAIEIMDKKLISAFHKAGIKEISQIPRTLPELTGIKGIGEASAQKILEHFKKGADSCLD